MKKKDFFDTLKVSTQSLNHQANGKRTQKTVHEVIEDLHACFDVKEKLLGDLSLYQNNKNITLTPSKSDIIINIGGQKISLLQEYKDFTNQDIKVSFAYQSGQSIKPQNFTYSPKTYWQNYIVSHPEHEQDILKSFYAQSREELGDHMIGIPRQTFTESSSYTLAGITHELGHIYANHLGKHLIDHERNANAFSIRFIRYIERKYHINTRILENDLYKTALASYQLGYLLHKNDPEFLRKNDPRYTPNKIQKFDDLSSKTTKSFI